MKNFGVNLLSGPLEHHEEDNHNEKHYSKSLAKSRGKLQEITTKNFPRIGNIEKPFCLILKQSNQIMSYQKVFSFRRKENKKKSISIGQVTLTLAVKWNWFNYWRHSDQNWFIHMSGREIINKYFIFHPKISIRNWFFWGFFINWIID